MKILSAFIFLFSMSLFIYIASADMTAKPKYDSATTHPNLVEEAISFYKNNGKMFKNVNNETFDFKTFIIKLRDGAIHEDHVDYYFLPGDLIKDPIHTGNRYYRHYYDFLHRNTNNGGGLWWNLGTNFLSAKDWAFANQGPLGLESGSHTWPDAIVKYRLADKDDEIKKGDAFFDLGHILHLIADMTVPAHTRNDAHASDSDSYSLFLYYGKDWEYPYKDVPYAYETWCKKYGDSYIKNGSLLIGADPLKITDQEPNPEDLKKYFDHLSEYTQTYYFSEDTVPGRLIDYYTSDYNKKPSIINMAEESYNGDTYVFYYGVDPDDPTKKIRLAYRSIMTKLRERMAPDGPYALRHPLVNEDYFIRLSKKAMRAIAGVVDLYVKLADTTLPSTPVGLEAVRGISAIDLSWSPSTDDLSGVAGYRIYRGGLEAATASNNYFKDTGLNPSTEYCYTVAALDSAGNISDKSSVICVTTMGSDLVMAYISGSVMHNDAQIGFIGLPFVTLNLSGTYTDTTTTGYGGEYQFIAPYIGNYVVTPSKEGYLFSPPNIEVQVTESKTYTLPNFVASEDRPLVTSTNPASNATMVSVTPSVTATFNKSMDASTINTSTFTLHRGSSLVPGTVEYNDSTKTATFTPSGTLLYSTEYTATVSSGVKSFPGITMEADYLWIFTTQSQPTVKPPAPENLFATAGDRQVSLTWNPVSSATSYNIYWGTSSGVSPQNGTKIPLITTNSYMHSGLTNGVAYYYVVTAENSMGEGDPSLQASATPALGPFPPTVETQAATSVITTGAVLNGSVIPNASLASAWFEWGTSPSLSTYGTTEWVPILDSGTTSVPVVFILSGLSPGTTYYFRVAAQNGVGMISRGGILSFTTTTTAVGVTGTWVGTYTTSLVDLTQITLILTQSGANVTGTYLTETGFGGEGGGTYTGIASGDVITWTVNQITPPECTGTFSGTSIVTGNTMSLTFTGTDCDGFHDNGQGTVTRQ